MLEVDFQSNNTYIQYIATTTIDGKHLIYLFYINLSGKVTNFPLMILFSLGLLLHMATWKTGTILGILCSCGQTIHTTESSMIQGVVAQLTYFSKWGYRCFQIRKLPLEAMLPQQNKKMSLALNVSTKDILYFSKDS